ncbi:MAG: dihydrofolate reductase [Proteobacteria bacterium]|nr:dihydrofolate reductase [Pseudomonadota bacterium]MDA1063460.1 dihydrofolate reductase [Pseudomonadota bacterium]
MISLIVAAANNNVIGVNGGLPWHLSDDLKRFKAITMGKPIVMGRKTYESIGRALPGRQNIVISTRADFAADGCVVVATTAAAIAVAAAAPEIMIIGGGQIYRLFLPLAERVYLTRVHVALEGDAHFPPLGESEWRISERVIRDNDDRHPYSFEFITLERQPR